MVDPPIDETGSTSRAEAESSFEQAVNDLAQGLIQYNESPGFAAQPDVTDFFRDHFADYFPEYPEIGQKISGEFGWSEETIPFTMEIGGVKKIFTYERGIGNGASLHLKTIDFDKLKEGIRQYISK